MFSTPLEAPELRFFLYMVLRMLVVAAVNFCFGSFVVANLVQLFSSLFLRFYSL